VGSRDQRNDLYLHQLQHNKAVSPAKNMRSSYLQDDGPLNVKRIHWIFHELPDTLHKDVLMRMSHMDVVAQCYETIKCGLGRNKGRRRGQTPIA
jgi:hypothetical protein